MFYTKCVSSEAPHPDSNRLLCGWILAAERAERLASVPPEPETGP